MGGGQAVVMARGVLFFCFGCLFCPVGRAVGARRVVGVLLPIRGGRSFLREIRKMADMDLVMTCSSFLDTGLCIG